LNWNDRSVKKLAELYKLYKEALQDKKVHEYFIQIIAKARKVPKLAADVKTVLDDLEKQILAIHDLTNVEEEPANAEGAEGQEGII